MLLPRGNQESGFTQLFKKHFQCYVSRLYFNKRTFAASLIVIRFRKVCLISPGTDLPGEWALLALGSFPGLLRQTLLVPHSTAAKRFLIMHAGIRSNQVCVRFKDLLKVVCASPPSQDASFTKSHLHSFTIPSPILAFFSSLRSATSVLSPSTIPLKRVKVAHAHAKYARPKHVAICRRAGLLCGNMQQGGRREHGAYAIFIAQLEVGI